MIANQVACSEIENMVKPSVAFRSGLSRNTKVTTAPVRTPESYRPSACSCSSGASSQIEVSAGQFRVAAGRSQ